MRSRRLLRLTGIFVLVVGGWLLLAPASLGGQLVYVVTSGTSMKPRFSTGDLAILRSSHTTHVGEVAAYRSHVLGRVVMHRVVDSDHGRYVFKGDNNNYRDPDRPDDHDVIGTLILRVPQAGAVLQRLTGPIAATLALVGLMIGVPATATARRRKRRGRSMSRHAAPRSSRAPILAGVPGRLRATLGLASLGLIASIATAAFVWTSPATVASGPVSRPPAQLVFSYSATVPPSPVYDGEQVTSPDPIFRALTNDVTFKVSYRAPSPHATGRYRLAATLSDTSGWHTTIPLSETKDFDGAGFVDSSTLHLNQLEERAHAAAKAAKVPMAQLTVAVEPTVEVHGQAAFAPKLRFSLTATQLRLLDPVSAMSVRGPSTPASNQAGRRPLHVGPFSLTTASARPISLLLGGASLAVALIALIAMRRLRPSSEADAIRRRYAQLLIRIQPMPVPATRPVVDVTEFATLAKLAERYGLLVLHWTRSEVETFVVQDEGTTYRYRTGSSTLLPSTHDQREAGHLAREPAPQGQ